MIGALGSTPEVRKQVEKDVREIYAARSGVAHFGSKKVSEELHAKALDLVSSLITRLLTDPELSSLPSAEAVGDWVRDRKYR
jgi:hypothetical protein